MKNSKYSRFTASSGRQWSCGLWVLLWTMFMGPLASVTLSASTVNWLGNGVDVNWQTANNWVTAPVAGDTLVFGAGGYGSLATGSITNDFAAGTQFNGFSFEGSSAFILGGNSINLGGNVANNSSVTQTLNMDLDLLQNTTVVAAGGNVDMGGVISGAFNLTKTGSNPLTLSGANSYTGNTIIREGTLSIAESGSLDSGGTVFLGGGLTASSTGARLLVAGVGGDNKSVNGITLSAGRSQLESSRSSGSGTFTLNVGTVSRVTGTTLAFATTNSVVNITNTNSSGILGSWARVGTNWASVDGSGNVVAYSAYTATSGAPDAQVIDNGATNNVQINAGGEFTKSGVTVNYNSTIVTGIDTTGLAVGDAVNGGFPATTGTGQMRILGGTYITAIDSANNEITLSKGVGRYWSGSNAGTVAAGVDLTFHHAVTLGASPLTEINTLQFTDSSTSVVDLGTSTLRLGATGGIWKSFAAGAVDTMGSSIVLNGGTLTAGGADDADGEIVLMAEGPNDTFSSGNASRNNSGIVINSKITDNDLGAGTGVVSVTVDSIQSVELNGDNTYTGGTYLNRGRLVVGSATGMGTGAVHISGDGLNQGQAILSSATTYANNFTISGASAAPIAMGSNTVLTGTITLAGDSLITGGASGNITNAARIEGEISGDYTLGLGVGGSSLILAHTNTNWTGGTTMLASGTSASLSNRVRLEANQALGGGDLTMNLATTNANPLISLDLYGHSQTINALNSTSTNGTLTKFYIDSTTGSAAEFIVGQGNGSGVFQGTIQDTGSGTLNLTKTGTGTQELSGVNTYNGSTTVNGGTLLISGTLTGTTGVTVDTSGNFNYTNAASLDRNVTVNSGGKFSYNSAADYTGTLTFTAGRLAGTNWNGSLSGLSIGSGQIIAPGNSPGDATTPNQTWLGGGAYEFEINDATGALGTNWDHLSVTSALDISALTAGTPFTIQLVSLDALNAAGLAQNFSSAGTYSWEFASFGSLTGTFAADLFTVDTSNFDNSFGGAFTVDQVGNTLVLNYSAIPEPSTYALLGIGVMALWALRRKRVA